MREEAHVSVDLDHRSLDFNRALNRFGSLNTGLNACDHGSLLVGLLPLSFSFGPINGSLPFRVERIAVPSFSVSVRPGLAARCGHV